MNENEKCIQEGQNGNANTNTEFRPDFDLSKAVHYKNEIDICTLPQCPAQCQFHERKQFLNIDIPSCTLLSKKDMVISIRCSFRQSKKFHYYFE
jgi:hypothetical protein